MWFSKDLGWASWEGALCAGTEASVTGEGVPPGQGGVGVSMLGSKSQC